MCGNRLPSPDPWAVQARNRSDEQRLPELPLALQGLGLPQHFIEPTPPDLPQNRKGLVANTRTENLSIQAQDLITDLIHFALSFSRLQHTINLVYHANELEGLINFLAYPGTHTSRIEPRFNFQLRQAT